jgi:hypothetical protein
MNLEAAFIGLENLLFLVVPTARKPVRAVKAQP